MRLILLSVVAVAYFKAINGQNCVGRVRSVSSAPTPTYGPACIKPAPNKAAPPAEDLATILQLVSLLSKAQTPPPPPPPPAPASPANNPLNSGGIIDKLIDALIITATQKNQPAPSSSRLIDIDVLKSLLNLKGSSSSTSSVPAQGTPVASSVAAPATASPASSAVPLTTSTVPAPSVLEDASSVVGGPSGDSLSSLSTALRTLLNPEK